MKQNIEAIPEKQTLSKGGVVLLESYEANVGQNRLYSFCYKLQSYWTFGLSSNL